MELTEYGGMNIPPNMQDQGNFTTLSSDISRLNANYKYLLQHFP